MKESHKNLIPWGWDQTWEKIWDMSNFSEERPARVVAVHRDHCLVEWGEKHVLAEVSGRFRFVAQEKLDFPATGDWAAVLPAEDHKSAVVHTLLPRRNLLTRKDPGSDSTPQVIAANVEIMFIVTSFTQEFSPRRLERFLLLAHESHIEPVILLNKSDLKKDEDTQLLEAREVAGEIPVLSLSAATGLGFDALSSYFSEGKTAIFLGSSGVGKSSLINRLAGADWQETQDVRQDDAKGRHTTTHREIFQLNFAGLVMDTPGLREVGVWADEKSLSETFDEFFDFSKKCRYQNCTHLNEPGCAVLEAVEEGAISQDRYASFLKLGKELAYLKRKQDPRDRANSKRRWKSIHKWVKNHSKRNR